MFWNATVRAQEVRGIREGASKKSGKPFLTLIVEDDNGGQNQISCTGDSISLARTLSKGDVCDFEVVIVSNPQYSYTSLSSAAGSDAIKVLRNSYVGGSHVAK